MVFIHDAGKAIEGLLQEGAPDAENVDKLFRLCLLADRPQAASDASRENDAIIMLFVHGCEFFVFRRPQEDVASATDALSIIGLLM